MDTVNTLKLAQKIVKQYAELLKKEINITAVYLFGSYVGGAPTDDSDIDVLVVSEDFTGDAVDDTLKLMKLRRQIDNRIEPHPFLAKDFNNQNPFANEVLKKNIRII